MSPRPRALTRRTGFLYDAVATGMWLYGHAAFRLTTLGPRRFRLPPGTLILSTHRRESDVPLICPPIWARAGMWHRRSGRERMSFAARDDMFLRGFFAGFPPALPLPARRLLYPIGVGRLLPLVQVYPLRSASIARLGEVLREREEAPLEELLPPERAEEFRARARASGLLPPTLAREALRGEYADLLWTEVTRRDLPAAGLDGFWSRRATQAAADFRALVAVLADGVLVVFPEGRPSPDGEIGPIQRGLGALVRRAEPSSFLPTALAYDPLTRGRTRAFVSLGPVAPTPTGDVEAAALALLRRTTPLTCGQIVAHVVDRREEPPVLVELEDEAADAVESARAEGRGVDPDLLDPRRRRKRLADALTAARAQPGDVPYLAREYRSARRTD